MANADLRHNQPWSDRYRSLRTNLRFTQVAAERHVRFNYSDFSLEQAVGAIKARVQERGGEINSPTPTRKAELLRAEEAVRQDKSNLLSSETAIYKRVEAFFAEIVKQCDEVNAQGHFTVQHQVHVQYRDVNQVCTVGQDSVSMIVIVTTACWANQG